MRIIRILAATILREGNALALLLYGLNRSLEVGGEDGFLHAEHLHCIAVELAVEGLGGLLGSRSRTSSLHVEIEVHVAEVAFFSDEDDEVWYQIAIIVSNI